MKLNKRKTLLRILSVTIAYALISILLFAEYLPVRADIVYTGSDITLNATNTEYVFVSRDTTATSSITYGTIGFTITRAASGEKQVDLEHQEYIVISLQTTGIKRRNEVDPSDSSKTLTETRIPKDTILRLIKEKYGSAEGSWYEDLATAEAQQRPCYLRFDAVMRVKHGKKELGWLIPPYTGQCLSEVFGGTYYSCCWDTQSGYGPGGPLIGPPDYPITDLISQTKGLAGSGGLYYAEYWRDRSSTLDHFNKWLNWTPDRIDDDDDGDDTTQTDSDTIPVSKETVATIGKEAPNVYTWNTSMKYDLSQGIPSSEYIVNGIQADKWYGKVNIAKHTGSFTYKFPYSGKWYETKTGVYVYEDTASGTYVEEPYSYTVTHTVVGTISRKVEYSYYYVGGCHLYMFDSAEVSNNAYGNEDGDHVIKYTAQDTSYKLVIDGKENPSTITTWDWTKEKDAYHVTEANVDTSTIRLEGNSSSDIIAKAKAIADARVKKPTVRNDRVEINGVVFMDDSDVDLNTSSVIEYKEVAAADYGTDAQSKKRLADDGATQIPAGCANGLYPTTLKATYVQFGLDSTKTTTSITRTTTKTGAEAIKAGSDSEWGYSPAHSYAANEPINVHTPVISTVVIRDKDGNVLTDQKTQLVNSSAGMVDYELRLDGTYSFKFDEASHRDIQGYGSSGSPSKYDKYVYEKLVRFPFSVEVNGVYYEPEESGYTEWITANTDQTVFYIPSWALEGVYGVGGITAPYNATTRMIEYRVEAINSDGRSDTRTQEGANTGDTGVRNTEDPNNPYGTYVATYHIPVEVSGIIYNFQVVGIDDQQIFGDGTEPKMDAYPFCKYKEEKRVGKYNRLGTLFQRFTKDSSLTTSWPSYNILPFTSGSSTNHKLQGYLSRGETFTFSVETIANLWGIGEDEDYITIEPTFRFVKTDKEKVTETDDDIQVYYSYKGKVYVLYGSEQDDALFDENTVSIGEYLFKDAYSDDSSRDMYDDVNYTAVQKEKFYEEQNGRMWYYNRNYVLYHEYPAYQLSKIVLRSGLNLYTGKYEKLARNLDKTLDNVEGLSITAEQYNKLRYSMQTWYGKYYIPQNLFVVRTKTLADLGVTDLDGDGDIDLRDYCEYGGTKGTGGIQEGDSIWEKDGYLVLNFSITTHNEGHDHLQYYAPNNGTKNGMGGYSGSVTKSTNNSAEDEWTKESGGQKSVHFTEDSIDYPDGMEIQTRPGDVGIISLDYWESKGSQYKAGVLWSW